MYIITHHMCKRTIYLAIASHAHCMVQVTSYIISNLKLDTACKHPRTAFTNGPYDQLVMSRCKLTFSKTRLTCSHK